MRGWKFSLRIGPRGSEPFVGMGGGECGGSQRRTCRGVGVPVATGQGKGKGQSDGADRERDRDGEREMERRQRQGWGKRDLQPR